MTDLVSTTDFIIQAPAIPAATVADLARQAGARAVIPIGLGTPAAFRFPEVERRDDLEEAARDHGCDAAFVPHDRTIERVRLVAMDMDSTLITIECIDEIADMLGIKPQVAAITASAMRGEIEFAQSLTRRVALLAGLPLKKLEEVYDERLRISPGAQRMLTAFKAIGAKTALVSGGFTFFTERLRTRLGFDYTLANTLGVEDGKLTGEVEGSIVDAHAKAQAVRRLKQEFAASDGDLTVTLGDGANDLPMFDEADVSVAYRAKPVVRARATHAIDHCGLDAALNLFR